MGAARGGRLRAWAELLRAPLLLSPAADVLAGWSVAAGHAWTVQQALADTGPETLVQIQRAGVPALLLAATTATCLLAAGMAQNAFVDRRDDAARKPDRPIPSGRIAPRAAFVAWVGLSVAGLLAGVAADLWKAALAIIIGTAAYHLVLKPLRGPACLMLGALRGLSLFLGAWAFDEGPFLALAPDGPVLVYRHATVAARPFVLLYAAYMAGASLHASTDDSRETSAWSRVGIATCLVTMITAAVFALAGWSSAHGNFEAGGVVLIAAFGVFRLARAWRVLPPGPLTGVALSGLFVLHALVCVGRGPPVFGWIAAGLVALLFLASRALRGGFPPT